MNFRSSWRGLNTEVMMSIVVGWKIFQIFEDFEGCAPQVAGFSREKTENHYGRIAHDFKDTNKIWRRTMEKKLEYKLKSRIAPNRLLSPVSRMNSILLVLGIVWGIFFRQIKARTRKGRQSHVEDVCFHVHVISIVHRLLERLPKFVAVN